MEGHHSRSGQENITWVMRAFFTMLTELTADSLLEGRSHLFLKFYS